MRNAGSAFIRVLAGKSSKFHADKWEQRFECIVPLSQMLTLHEHRQHSTSAECRTRVWHHFSRHTNHHDTDCLVVHCTPFIDSDRTAVGIALLQVFGIPTVPTVLPDAAAVPGADAVSADVVRADVVRADVVSPDVFSSVGSTATETPFVPRKSTSTPPTVQPDLDACMRVS